MHLHQPKPSYTYLVWDHKEVIGTPMGPEEGSGVWRAQARLGIACTGAFCWGAGTGAKGKWYDIFGRCLEKGLGWAIRFPQRGGFGFRFVSML